MLSEPEHGSISLPQRVAQRPRVSASPFHTTLPISMSVRSFTVFQDTPSESPQSHDDNGARAMTLSATDAAATLLSTLAAIEKENLHPVTGQRTGPAVGSETKKRKTGVLATKVLVVPSAKKHKELKGEPKKTRKPLSSAGKPRSSDTRKSSSKSSRSSRKASPLPPLAEENESQRQPPRLSVSQIDIDSRCYELTVSPLADVSAAYDATHTESQESDVHTERVRTRIAWLSSGTDKASRKSRWNRASVTFSLLPQSKSLSRQQTIHHAARTTPPVRPTISRPPNASASIPPSLFPRRHQPRNDSSKHNRLQYAMVPQSDESIGQYSFRCHN